MELEWWQGRRSWQGGARCRQGRREPGRAVSPKEFGDALQYLESRLGSHGRVDLKRAALSSRREDALQESNGVTGRNPLALGSCDTGGNWMEMVLDKRKNFSFWIFFFSLFYL